MNTEYESKKCIENIIKYFKRLSPTVKINIKRTKLLDHRSGRYFTFLIINNLKNKNIELKSLFDSNKGNIDENPFMYLKDISKTIIINHRVNNYFYSKLVVINGKVMHNNCYERQYLNDYCIQFALDDFLDYVDF